MVEVAGGNITVDAENGKGPEFIISLSVNMDTHNVLYF
jgi:hypothetical protein